MFTNIWTLTLTIGFLMISVQTEVNKSSQIHLIHLILEAIFQGEGYISIHAKNSGKQLLGRIFLLLTDIC